MSEDERENVAQTVSELTERLVAPTTLELQVNGRSYPPNFLHESWNDYLYWDTELENS